MAYLRVIPPRYEGRSWLEESNIPPLLWPTKWCGRKSGTGVAEKVISPL